MQNTLPITGSDIEHGVPFNGVIALSGLVTGPKQMVSIKWEVDNASGSTECEAWRGQYEIDNLTRAGYRITRVELFK